MGSVIDYIECPNCKHEAYSDFYYKTGEEYVNCQNCGYHYSATFKCDDEGNYILEFEYNQEPELVMDILKHGSSVEVLAPQSLINHVQSELKTALSLYK